jgi:hypothetical protein
MAPIEVDGTSVGALRLGVAADIERLRSYVGGGLK